MLKHIVHFLKSPLGLAIGVFGGILMGQFFPAFGTEVGVLGLVVIDLMKMCIIPILLTSVAISTCNFLTIKANINAGRVMLSFASIFVLAGCIGIGTAFLLSPGSHLDAGASPQLKRAALDAAQIERSISEPITKTVGGDAAAFIKNAIPSNIFDSLATDRYFQILVFSLIFGVTLAFIQDKNRIYLTDLLQGIRETFEKIFSGITVLLPIAIFLIMAMDVAKVGAETLLGMLEFVAAAYLAFFLMFACGMMLISYRLKINPIKAAAMIKQPIMISIVAHSGIAAIPAAIKSLTENYQMDKTVTNLLASVGLVMGQFGIVLYFSFSAIFVAQFYNHEIATAPLAHLDTIAFVLMMAIVASLSTIGSTGTLLLPLISIVLDPLGLPVTALLVLFIAIDPIIDPFRSMILLHGNLTSIVLAAGKPVDPQMTQTLAHPRPPAPDAA